MKLNKWLPVALGSIIALGSSVAAQADATLDKIEQRHVLVVGVLLSGGPFGSIDPTTQKPKGLNVDLANELGRQLKAEVQLVPVLPAYVGPQEVPIFAVTAGARHRLPKIRACIDHWAGWLAQAEMATRPAP